MLFSVNTLYTMSLLIHALDRSASNAFLTFVNIVLPVVIILVLYIGGILFWYIGAKKNGPTYIIQLMSLILIFLFSILLAT